MEEGKGYTKQTRAAGLIHCNLLAILFSELPTLADQSTTLRRLCPCSLDLRHIVLHRRLIAREVRADNVQDKLRRVGLRRDWISNGTEVRRDVPDRAIIAGFAAGKKQ